MAPGTLGDKPVLLVSGMKDRALGSQAILDKWKAYFPQAEIVVVADANHFIQEDAPDRIADAVLARFG